MKISIITVCYNAAATLATAMESVLNQTYPDIEYIVVDGGSKDGTVGILRAYAKEPLARARQSLSEPLARARQSLSWISEPDQGMYDAINKGIRLATGDVVGILNADDVLEDDGVIERVAERFIAQKIDVVYGDVRFVRTPRQGEADPKRTPRRGGALPELASLRSAKTLRYYSAKRWKPWMLRWGFMPPHPSVYIRRECFERLGLYKTDYHIAADYELLIRYLWKAGLKTVYMPQCLVTMRMGGKSTKNWRSNLLLNQEIVRGNRENGYFCALPMLLIKYVFKVWEFVLPNPPPGRGSP